MVVLQCQNSAVHQTRVKQRGSRVKPEVATVLLAQGVFRGWPVWETETEREKSKAGESPKMLTPSVSVHQYQAYPCTRAYNSLDLLLNSSPLRPFCASNSTQYCTHLFSFFLAVQHHLFLEPVLKANIYMTKYHQNSLFTILHRNLTGKVSDFIKEVTPFNYGMFLPHADPTELHDL